MSSKVTVPAHRYKLVKLTLPAQSVYESGYELTLDVTNIRDHDLIYEMYWRDDGKAALRITAQGLSRDNGCKAPFHPTREL